MSENKGTYAFSPNMLNKRLDAVAHAAWVPSNHQALKKLTELAIQLSTIAESALEEAMKKPTYTDEEVRELARHLNAVIKSVESDPNRTYGYTAVSDAREFLERKKYFNLNQSDLIV